MYQLALNINILILLFVYCEPSNTYRNYFNDHRNDSIPFNASNANVIKDINELTAKIFLNVTASTKAPPSLRTSPRNIPSRSVPIPSLVRKNFEENITTSYYTTHVDGYPDFSLIAPKLKQYQGFVIRDSLPPPELDPHSLIDHDAHTYRHLCRTEIELITPREIVNKANKLVRIVNYPDLYEQVIRAETCGEKDSPCSFGENFPNNLIPICKQHYIFRQLLTMSDSNDPDLAIEDIPIPSCCECVLKDITLK